MEYQNASPFLKLFADLHAEEIEDEAGVCNDEEEEGEVDRAGSGEEGEGIGTPMGTPSMTHLPSLGLYPQMSFDEQVSVSVVFHSQFIVNGASPDIGFLTSDNFVFYGHSHYLRAISQNAFNGLLDVEGILPGAILKIVCAAEDAMLLNVVWHTVYHLSCGQFQPSLDTLLGAIQVLKTYGVPLDRFVGLSTPLYRLISTESPRRPLEVFLMATENELEDLAVSTSSFFLSFPMTSITDEIVDRMGPRYLKRVMLLYWSRIHLSKELLFDAPQVHPDIETCGFVQQKGLQNAWRVAAGGLLYRMQADLSIGLIRSTMGSLEDPLTCGICKTAVKTKVREIILNWSEAKVQCVPVAAA